MWPYFAMYGVIVGAFLYREVGALRPHALQPFTAGLMIVFLTLVIGWRHEVGGDWVAYIQYVERARFADPVQIFQNTEPGYNLLNWLVVNAGGDVYTVNLISAFVFSVGLVAFARRQPSPLLTLVVAYPYLVMIVAMGYSRQAIAIGIFFLGLNQLTNRRILSYLLLIGLAGAFHKTAIILAPLALVVRGQHRWVSILVVFMASIGLYQQFLSSEVDSLYKNYWEAEYNSQGALIRTLLNLLPAIVFLVWRRRFGLIGEQRDLWTWLSVACILLFLLLLVASSSTVVDRLGLYLIPVQLFVFNRLPAAFCPSEVRERIRWRAAVVVLYGAVMAVWLFFAGHAFAWLPYSFYPALWLGDVNY